MPRPRDPAQAVQLLDLLSEFFDSGRRWIKDEFHDDQGNRCLISAIAHLRAVMKISGDGTGYYLREAQPQWRYKTIVHFNDDCQSYDEIRALIRSARALAQAELDADRHSKHRPPAEASRVLHLASEVAK